MVFLIKGGILVFLICLNTARLEDGFFYGGSISYKLEDVAGKKIAHVELITGWKLGKGPCGATCSKRDVNQVINTRRNQKEQSIGIQNYFGNFTTYYVVNRTSGERDLNAIVHSNYTEWVIAVSEQAKWEQEFMKFSFEMEHADEDINFDGRFWRPLMYGHNFKWHFQTKAVRSIRSDTNRMNNCPQVVTKAFYRVKLNTVSIIRIPMMDPDGDIVRCHMAEFIEGGKLTGAPAPGVKVHNESVTNVCKVSIDANMYFGYTDDSWIAVPVTFRDYNTKKIHFGIDNIIPGVFSLSSTSAQFAVQVLENLVTPEFVSPTIEGDHKFIAYVGSIWSVDIYAQAPVNTTIDEYIPFGRNREPITVSTIKEDRTRDRVTYTTMSWEPFMDDIGQHILCVRVVDNTGVDADEFRCYALQVRAETFNHSSTVQSGKPYFIDIPSTKQFFNCEMAVTCLIPVFVKSVAHVKTIQVTDSFTDETTMGRVEAVTYKGDSAYKAVLSFTHSMPGVEKICLSATDINNITSETVCINSEIAAPDPCLSAPCRNSATCRSNRRTGTFVCECLSSHFYGSLCEKRLDPCNPIPCIKDHTIQYISIGEDCFCVCKPGFKGNHCEENIYDCRNDSCDATRGTCRDLVDAVTCDCYPRYSGTNCTTDECPHAGSGMIACPADGCSPSSCSGHGVCLQGGHCACRMGYDTDDTCSRSFGQYPGVTEIKFVAPTPKDRSQYTCVIESNTIKPCHLSVFVASTGSTPTLNIETTSVLSANTTMGNVTLSSVLPGINNIYSTDIVIQGNVKDSNGHYVCVTAREGFSEAELCLELKFIIAPHLDVLQKNATVKFIDPTQVEGSRLVGYVTETYTVMLFTTYTSSCENVITTSEDVTVFPPVYDGVNTCVTEASFVLSKVGPFDVCFQSASSNFQKRCFIAEGISKCLDPCSSSPCQNNGRCFPKEASGFHCICQTNYFGKLCQEGPCLINDCQNGAYCKIYNRNTTCICKAGSEGPKCEVPSSQIKPKLTFTDTAKPKLFDCVIYQPCSISLLITGQNGGKPQVSAGYASATFILDDIQTMDSNLSGSYKINIKLIARETGIKDACIQSLNKNSLLKDELCFKVNVIADMSAVYGFEDRPHFVYPSLPNDAKVECQESEPCHVLYEITPGDGNEKQCISATSTGKVEVQNYHMFSSCESCTPGRSYTGNCSLDISLQTTADDVHLNKTFCVALSLTGTNVTGESRCFDVRVVSKTEGEEKKGCQLIECKNGGFCDGHIPDNPTCFCKKGYFGEKCDGAAGTTQITSGHSHSFFEDLTIPLEIKCNIGQTCVIPFEVVTAIRQRPDISLGYADPSLSSGKLTYLQLGNSSAVYTGTVDIRPSKVGTFSACLQLNVNRTALKEFCVTVKVSDAAVEHIDMSKPRFVSPTLPKDSTVLCTIKKSCHLDLYSTRGEDFGVPGKCPNVIETNMSQDTGIYIFAPEYQSRSCYSDVTYIATVEGKRQLCFQVAFPGKKGESRCYTVKLVADVTKKVTTPCTGVTCGNGGKCIADSRSIPAKPICICALGFTGSDCKTAVKNNTSLPGVNNFPNTTVIEQFFDSHSAVPKDVRCDEINPCCVVIPYHGDKNKPPMFGYKDSSLAIILNTTIADTLQHNLNYFQTCVKGVPGKKYRMCLQTTANGTIHGINIDEICLAVEFRSGGQDHSSTEPKFTGSLSNGSSVLCQPNSTCHMPVITDMMKSGSCAQVKECSTHIAGAHVFTTNAIGDKCVTDVAIQTSENATTDWLCIKAGFGGEERVINVVTKKSNEYGPCQKKHCLNGGRCNSTTEATAMCECPPGYSGVVCEGSRSILSQCEHFKELSKMYSGP